MHNNYYFLRQLTPALSRELVGSTITMCFSQNKDELLLGFKRPAPAPDFYLQAILTAQFSSLYFPESFNRARANSINLLSGIIGEQVLNIVLPENERSFYLALTNQKVLLFKLFGNRSNIIFFEPEQAPELFHRKFAKDAALDWQQLDRLLHPDKAAFLQNIPSPEKIYPTFGDLPVLYLRTQGYDAATPEQKWELIQQVKAQLEKPGLFYLIKLAHQTRFSLLPVGDIITTFTDPLAALNEFVRRFLSEYNFAKNYRTAYQNLARKVQSTTQYLTQTRAKLKMLQQEASYAQTADVIMANLTQIPPRTESITLYDFYLDQERVFNLKPTETPQKFAERLYKKSKNQQIEIHQLQDRLQHKEEDLLEFEIALQELTAITDYKTLKTFLKVHTEALEKPQTPAEEPFRVFTAQGFKILVGKNAKNNDVLTQKYTHKDDLWLHAKDVTGSHVVIKYQSGKSFPTSVVEKAAQLAAYYSKRKTDSLCPVLYTPKKYVRKPKGAAPGQVVVEREKVLLVKPGNPFEKVTEP